MPPKEKLYDRLFRAVGVDKEKMPVKLTQAPPIVNRSTFKTFSAGIVMQADLIYMPNDNNYNYVLTVVDVASRSVDAEPLEGRTCDDVIQGFKTIFGRNYIKPPKFLYTDPGTEFKNDAFHKYIESFGTIIRHTMTARKNQMAIVEYYNHIITKVLGTKMTAAELEHHEHNTDWVESLPALIEELNKEKREQKISDFLKMPIFAKKEKLLKVGDYVHVRLQQPKDAISGNRLNGGFRHGDQRFDEKVTEISGVLIRPGQPVRYMVKGIDNASFLRSELLLADDAENVAENQKKDKDKKDKEDAEKAEAEKKRNFKGANVMKLRNRDVYME